MNRFYSFLALFALIGSMAVAIPAYGATGSLSCTDASGVITCTGASWSVSTSVDLELNTSASCDDESQWGWACTTDGSGNLPAGCNSLQVPLDDAYYVYGTEDSCSTSTGASTNPQDVSGNITLTAGGTSIGTAFDDTQDFLLTHILALVTAIAVVGVVVVLLGLGLRKLGIRRSVRKL